MLLWVGGSDAASGCMADDLVVVVVSSLAIGHRVAAFDGVDG
jgi:hypothetical protein